MRCSRLFGHYSAAANMLMDTQSLILLNTRDRTLESHKAFSGTGADPPLFCPLVQILPIPLGAREQHLHAERLPVSEPRTASRHGPADDKLAGTRGQERSAGYAGSNPAIGIASLRQIRFASRLAISACRGIA